MPTIDVTNLDHVRRLDARAVQDSVLLVRQASTNDLLRPTPCSRWTLAGLLAHMTAQHRGFAAAVEGRGEDLAHWRVLPFSGRTMEAVVAEYDAAARQVVAAFSAVTTPDQPFFLPEVRGGQAFPAVRAIGFHLVDYVVHAWDVARGLGLTYDPGAELLAAALPLARDVPGGAARLAPGSAFGPSLPENENENENEDGATDGDGGDGRVLAQILRTLGRSPDWLPPSGEVPATGQRAATARDTAC
ncbi:TIGR03086 family metal-binding protein [Streptomyces sp. NPDC059786]|uniref:TIGR03086 family metal-binding protein n=1 Tax=Streptomyces sp. NPDC059786 TaxID=3346946 RepID=UPI00364F164C